MFAGEEYGNWTDPSGEPFFGEFSRRSRPLHYQPENPPISLHRGFRRAAYILVGDDQRELLRGPLDRCLEALAHAAIDHCDPFVAELEPDGSAYRRITGNGQSIADLYAVDPASLEYAAFGDSPEPIVVGDRDQCRQVLAGIADADVDAVSGNRDLYLARRLPSAPAWQRLISRPIIVSPDEQIPIEPAATE